MDNPSQAGREDDQRVAQEIMGRGGAPSFVRRAKKAEESYQLLLDGLAGQREEHLAMVRLRVGQLHALAGDWNAVRPLLRDPTDADRLQALHDEMRPQLRMPLEPTASRRTLRGALRELIETIEMFNARWGRLLSKVDLAPLNRARDEYNRYYVLEKECAVGASRGTRLSFRPLPPITTDDLRDRFPLLPVPTLA